MRFWLLITYMSSEGSGEPVHLRFLTRLFTAQKHKVWMEVEEDSYSSSIGFSPIHV